VLPDAAPDSCPGTSARKLSRRAPYERSEIGGAGLPAGRKGGYGTSFCSQSTKLEGLYACRGINVIASSFILVKINKIGAMKRSRHNSVVNCYESRIKLQKP
jgi:hypothetical protein